jgi:hypothetical protein
MPLPHSGILFSSVRSSKEEEGAGKIREGSNMGTGEGCGGAVFMFYFGGNGLLNCNLFRKYKIIHALCDLLLCMNSEPSELHG